MSSKADRPEAMQGCLFPLDDHDGPAPPLSDARADQMTNAVLHRAWPTPRVRSHRRRVLILLAAAIVLAAMSALAGVWLQQRRQAPPTTPAETAPSATIPAEPAVSGAAEAPTDEEEADPPPVESAPSASEAPATRPPAPPPTSAAEPQRRVDLLRQANRLRSQKRWSDAERLYRRVATEFPGTPEAYTATVAAASIRLEHLGDPEGAREMFGAAQQSRPEGGLSEEADFGVAESYRAAGNERAEAAALRSFLSRHPDSPMRAKAQARLAELEARRSSNPAKKR